MRFRSLVSVLFFCVAVITVTVLVSEALRISSQTPSGRAVLTGVVQCEIYPSGITACGGDTGVITARTLYCYKGSQELADLLHLKRAPWLR